MIINIPISIDEKVFEGKIQNEYDKIIKEKIFEEVIKTLELADSSWHGKAENGMRNLINNKLDNYMKDYKDEIIEKAAQILADRVGRTKKAKEELINGKDNS